MEAHADTHAVATATAVPAGAVKSYVLPSADVAGALGYHDVDPQGDPYIRVFVDTTPEKWGHGFDRVGVRLGVRRP